MNPLDQSLEAFRQIAELDHGHKSSAMAMNAIRLLEAQKAEGVSAQQLAEAPNNTIAPLSRLEMFATRIDIAIRNQHEPPALNDRPGWYEVRELIDYLKELRSETRLTERSESQSTERILGYADSGGGIRWREDAAGYTGHLWSGPSERSESTRVVSEPIGWTWEHFGSRHFVETKPGFAGEPGMPEVHPVYLNPQPVSDGEIEAAASRWPTVDAFAEVMRQKLDENKHKRGWSDDSALALFDRCGEELEELELLLDTFTDDGPDAPLPEERPTYLEIAREAADVANFAMMIADVCGGFAIPKESRS